MKEIFGEEEYNDNDILLPEDLNGREIAAPGQYPHAVNSQIILYFLF